MSDEKASEQENNLSTPVTGAGARKGERGGKSGSCHKRSLGDRSEFDWGTRLIIRILIPRIRALSKSMGKRFKEIVKTSLKIRKKVHYGICSKKSGACLAKLL